MILQNNSYRTVAKVSLKAQTLHTVLMILQKNNAKTEGRSCSQNSFSDDKAQNQCKELKRKSLSKQFYLMMMQEIQARQESKSLSKHKLNRFTKLHSHLV